MASAGYIIEEKIMHTQKYLHPMQIVGVEGVCASLMWTIVLLIFQFLPCHNESFCTDERLENTYNAWEDYASNSMLIYQSIAILLIIPFSSIFGVSTTKHGSASSRITILLARNLVVWIFFISVPIDTYDGIPVYSEYFTWLQLIGFIILAFGVLIYNEIILLPFCGQNKLGSQKEVEEDGIMRE